VVNRAWMLCDSISYSLDALYQAVNVSARSVVQVATMWEPQRRKAWNQRRVQQVLQELEPHQRVIALYAIAIIVLLSLRLWLSDRKSAAIPIDCPRP